MTSSQAKSYSARNSLVLASYPWISDVVVSHDDWVKRFGEGHYLNVSTQAIHVLFHGILVTLTINLLRSSSNRLRIMKERDLPQGGSMELT